MYSLRDHRAVVAIVAQSSPQQRVSSLASRYAA
jgi:hypothetical protein